jgi:hypothetical protein
MIKWLTLMGVLLVALWVAPAVAEDCVDIKLGAGIVPGDPNDILSVGFYAENCGSEPGMATVKVFVGVDGETVGSAKFTVRVPAGIPVQQKLSLPVPQGTPPGTYTLCLAVELGSATDSACATVTIDDKGQVLGFYPHESTPWGVSTWSWGGIKAGYK